MALAFLDSSQSPAAELARGRDAAAHLKRLRVGILRAVKAYRVSVELSPAMTVVLLQGAMPRLTCEAIDALVLGLGGSSLLAEWSEELTANAATFRAEFPEAKQVPTLREPKMRAAGGPSACSEGTNCKDCNAR